MATTQYYFFQPTLNGQPFDPASTAGAVDYLYLFSTPDDRDAGSNPVIAIDSALPVGDGTYRFDLPSSLPEGRYWLRAAWRQTLLDDPVFESLGTLDYPLTNPPIVRAEDVAPLLGLVIPLTAAQRAQVNECIADAQATVELAIGPILPKRLVLKNAYYDDAAGLDRMAASTWFVDTTNVTIEDWAVNFDSTYDVTYLYGFDGRNESPIRRFVVRYAAAWWRRAFGGDQSFGQTIASVATEGQSVSYNTKERSTDVDPSIGMSLDALIARYGSAAKNGGVKVFQRRNQWYGEDRTQWPGDGVVWWWH
jgi:hypothetical protein